MITPPRRLVLLLAATLTAACRERPQSGPVTGKILLRYHPPAGATYGYTFQQVSVITGESGPVAQMGEQRMSVAARLHQQVGRAVPESIEVVTTLDSLSIDAPLAAANPAVLAQARGVTTTLVLDDRLRPVRVVPPAADGATAQVVSQLAAGLKTMSYPFPDSAVGAGDSWTAAFAVPFSDFVGGRPITAQTTLTVAGIELVRGDTVVRLTFDTKLPSAPFPIMVYGQTANITLGGGLTGEQTFSLSRGAIVRTTYAGRITVESRGGILGNSPMRVGIDQRATLTLDGTAPGP